MCELWGWISISTYPEEPLRQGMLVGWGHPAAQGGSWGCGNAVP